jgi:murein DD-endopeptidase MepM/ murein hydrolase activator NlpD
MDLRVWIVLVGAFPLLAGSACAQPHGRSVKFEVPVDCDIGIDCLIQKYVDMDASPGRADHRCGLITTDGHDGIDFRVRTRADMVRGVAVLAAASGRVLRVRDGESDVSVKVRGATDGRDAGNAVIIAHDGDSETQYSHLRQNSVTVKPGDRVEVGTAIGLIGMSGNAEFPHLHFSVRIGGSDTDPFSGRKVGDGCAPATSATASLWSPAAALKLAYRDVAIVSVGIASAVPSASTGDRAENPGATLSNGDAMILWAEAIGARPGDQQTFRITGPGNISILDTSTTIERGGLVWFAYNGRRAPPGGWSKGQYRGAYSLSRPGAPPVVQAIQFSIK